MGEVNMTLNTMTTAMIALAFAGGITVGVTVQTVVQSPEMNVEAAVTAALMNFDERRRERDRQELDAAKAEADKAFGRAMQGWGECDGCGATLPWGKGAGK
jgi:hypothetical protein